MNGIGGQFATDQADDIPHRAQLNQAATIRHLGWAGGGSKCFHSAEPLAKTFTIDTKGAQADWGGSIVWF